MSDEEDDAGSAEGGSDPLALLRLVEPEHDRRCGERYGPEERVEEVLHDGERLAYHYSIRCSDTGYLASRPSSNS
jgi:hypothetical protein